MKYGARNVIAAKVKSIKKGVKALKSHVKRGLRVDIAGDFRFNKGTLFKLILKDL